MDEQQVLLYLSEFHRSEVPSRVQRSRGIGSSFTRNTPPLEKAQETGISSRMRAYHRLETWFGGTRSFRCSTNFIYLFFSPSPYPQESSPLFIPQLWGQSCSNFVTTMETTPRFENVAQICLFPRVSLITYDDKMLT